MNIAIYVPDLFPNDATANYARAQGSMLESFGHKVTLLAERQYVDEVQVVKNIEEIDDSFAHNNLLIYHYGIKSQSAQRLSSMNFKRKKLYFHNITDPNLYEGDPLEVVLKESWEQLFTIANRFDDFFANSSFTIEEFKQKSSYRFNFKWIVLPPRIECFSRDNRSTSKSFFEKKKQICMVGRIVRHKNTNIAIKVFEELSLIDPNISLLIIGKGKGEYYEHIKASSYRQANIKILSDISDEERNCIVSSSIASFNLSSHEGFCLPVYESMRQDTIPFYGSSQWLHDWIDEDKIRIGMSNNFVRDAHKIANVVNSPNLFRNIIDSINKKLGQIDQICAPSHQYNQLIASHSFTDESLDYFT